MSDILTQDMQTVFRNCQIEGLPRVLIYLENFKDKEIKVQASFKRKDIPLIKVWVEGQKEEQRNKEKKEERIWNLVFLIIGATISAFVVWTTTRAQLGSMEKQHETTILQQENANKQNLVRLQAELRPYLIPRLRNNPPHFIIDEQSVMTFNIHEKHLLVNFELDNVGKMPARNIRARYDGPGYYDKSFDLAKNVILPGDSAHRCWTPWVSISNIAKGSENKPFEIVLSIEYSGNEDIDNRRYLSLLKLTIQKDDNKKYKVIDQDFNFQYKKGK